MFKRFAIALLIAASGTAAVVFYYWQQATQLPDWYQGQAMPSQSPEENASPNADLDRSKEAVSNHPVQPSVHRSPQKSLNAKLSHQIQQTPPGQPVKVQLNQREINHLFTTEIARKTETQALNQAIKGVNTTVQNGRIETGAVVNLADVSTNQLSSNEQNTVARLVKLFPALSDRQVYVAVVGKPAVVNGQVMLSDDTRIKVGNLSFTPAELAQRLGVSEAQVREKINLEIQLGNLKVEDIRLEGDRAIVQGQSN